MLECHKRRCERALIPDEMPSYPFQMLDTDLFCVEEENYIMVVDYLTKWPVVKSLKQAMSSRSVKQALQEVCADWATADKIVNSLLGSLGNSAHNTILNR